MSGQEEKISILDKVKDYDHHCKVGPDYSRPPYRDGKRKTAIKSYCVSKESPYLMLHSVPSLNLVRELKSFFKQFGQIDFLLQLTNYPHVPPFTEVYLLKYDLIVNARFAKRKADDRSFFGGSLHICYAPEFESISECRLKLHQRRAVVRAKLIKNERERQELQNQWMPTATSVPDTSDIQPRESDSNIEMVHEFISNPNESMDTADSPITSQKSRKRVGSTISSMAAKKTLLDIPHAFQPSVQWNLPPPPPPLLPQFVPYRTTHLVVQWDHARVRSAEGDVFASSSSTNFPLIGQYCARSLAASHITESSSIIPYSTVVAPSTSKLITTPSPVTIPIAVQQAMSCRPIINIKEDQVELKPITRCDISAPSVKQQNINTKNRLLQPNSTNVTTVPLTHPTLLIPRQLSKQFVSSHKNTKIVLGRKINKPLPSASNDQILDEDTNLTVSHMLGPEQGPQIPDHILQHLREVGADAGPMAALDWTRTVHEIREKVIPSKLETNNSN